MGLPLVNWEVLILLFSNYPDIAEEKKLLPSKKQGFFMVLSSVRDLSPCLIAQVV
ncbi:MAG: hypothetical protein RLZZ338_2285 [Cyanobacteriota bacterium]|jgi:hypothetical protein